MKLSVWILLLLCLFLIPFCAFAQTNVDNHEKRIQELETEVIKLKAQNEHYQFLKGEIKNYRENITNEEKGFTDFIKFIIYVAGGLVTVAIGLLTFFGIKTYRNVAKWIKETTKQNMKKVISTEMESHTEKINALEQLITKQLRQNKCRVLIIGQETDRKSMGKEIEELEKCVGEVEFMIFNEKEFKKKLEESIDAVVLKYQKNESINSDERLEAIVTLLNKTGQEIPLIIYYNGRLEEKEKDKETCNKYFWTNFSNSPCTLVGNVYMLAHAFN